MRIGADFSGAMLYSPMSILRSRQNAAQGKEADSASEARREAVRAMIPENKSQNDMAAQERQVLAREQALKASAAGGDTHTTYTYAIGPDGKKYITGAEVSIVGTEDVLDSVPGGTRTSRNAGTQTSAEPEAPSEAATSEESPEVKAQIAELQQTEREVIAHEAAHMAAGGQFAGAASYSYTTGPDGKQYITGGEVPISTPATSDPEEALQNAQQVMRAAMAPANPSGPDIAVAASAAQTAANARAEIAKSGGDDTRAEAVDAASLEQNPSDDDEAESIDAYTGLRARGAYASTKSVRGLWTESRGFEPMKEASDVKTDQYGDPVKDEGFQIAA